MAALEREIADVAPRMAAEAADHVPLRQERGRSRDHRADARKHRAAAEGACRARGDPDRRPHLLQAQELRHLAARRPSFRSCSTATPRRSRAGSRICIEPFADPEIMAVGGFTVLGYDDLLSKTFALELDFRPSPRSARRPSSGEKIHANNCAVRTDFFRENPFPDLPAFKKQCGFWLRDLTAKRLRIHPDRRGDDGPRAAPRLQVPRLARVDDGHGPRLPGRSRPRPARASAGSASRSSSSAARSARAGGESGPAAKKVDLPVWQRPAAMAIILGFYGVGLAGEIGSALTRSFEPLPKPKKAETAKPRRCDSQSPPDRSAMKLQH